MLHDEANDLWRDIKAASRQGHTVCGTLWQAGASADCTCASRGSFSHSHRLQRERTWHCDNASDLRLLILDASSSCSAQKHTARTPLSPHLPALAALANGSASAQSSRCSLARRVSCPQPAWPRCPAALPGAAAGEGHHVPAWGWAADDVCTLT